MRKIVVMAALVVGVCAASGSSTAQSSGAAAATAPCSDQVFRQFDFWVGAWDVFTTDGKLAGSNVITKEEYGCLLLERWTAAGGSTGQSYNFVDLATGKWRQIWVSAGATIDYAGGLDADGAMTLEGTIGYGAGNPANGARFRGSWTPGADGSVTQRFQQYDPAREEWTDWFIGVYRRKAE